MRAVHAAIAATALASLLASCASDPVPGGSEAVVVLGAASTRVLNDEMRTLIDAPLTFNNAGSSTLVQQLRDGAPGDVLITADQKNMDDAVRAGVARDPEVVATNSMVLVVPKGNPAGVRSVDDLERGDVNFVMCDAQVPCGTVSQQLLSANSLNVHPVSLEHNVADTLGKVVSGEADAAFVYRTDAAAAGSDVDTVDIPHAAEFPNSLVAGVVTSSEHPGEAVRAEQTRRAAADEDGVGRRQAARGGELELAAERVEVLGVGRVDLRRGVRVEVAVPAARRAERDVDVDAERVHHAG